MKIIIIGNLATGKTSLTKEIINLYPDFESISIDTVRRQHGDNTVEGEARCRRIFLGNIRPNDCNQIIEFSGIGLLAESTLRKINSSSNLLIIYLRTALNIINARIEQRVWDIPVPHYMSNTKKVIEYTHNEYANGLMEKFFLLCPTATLISTQNNTREDFFNNIQLIKNNIDTMLDRNPNK